MTGGQFFKIDASAEGPPGFADRVLFLDDEVLQGPDWKSLTASQQMMGDE